MRGWGCGREAFKIVGTRMRKGWGGMRHQCRQAGIRSSRVRLKEWSIGSDWEASATVGQLVSAKRLGGNGAI